MKEFSIKTIFITLTFILLISCGNKEEKDFERVSITINNQKFEILTAHRIFNHYIKDKSDYTTDVFNRIEEEFNDNLAYPFLFDAVKNEIKPDKKLKEVIELMKGIDFPRIVDSSFRSATKKLPGPDTKILFIPTNPAYRNFYRQFGYAFHAFTPGAGKIIVTFDPTFDNWRQFLPYALVHEYYHSVWTEQNFERADFTPLEYIIFEGKADSFADEIFPNVKHPFINKLDRTDEKRIWSLIKPQLNERDAEINDNIFYGTEEIPLGSVYAIGFNILKSFKVNNPGMNDSVLMDMPPDQVLTLSKYDE